jgi:putative heme-binding domain-containing protein
LRIAERPEQPPELRVAALAVAAPKLSEVTESQFQLLAGALSTESPVAMRSAAADALVQAPLSREQLDELCEVLKSAGPLELNRLLAAFERAEDEPLGLKLVSSLREASALHSLRVDILRAALSKYGDAVQRGVDELESLVNVDAAAQRKRIEELLPHISQGDVRRGHAVFYSSKAACSACHRLGYAGGTVGPELTRIGEIRTERDLLESILYPNLSFVQSYESVLVLTTEGKAINGRIVDESHEGYLLATGPDEKIRVRRTDVDDMQPSTASVMPAGLDRQLSVEELADLVAFLKSAK